MAIIQRVLATAVQEFDRKPLGGLIDDTHAKFVAWKVTGKEGEKYTMIFTYRRMGIDNGMDTYVHLDNNLRIALRHMTDTNYSPSKPV